MAEVQWVQGCFVLASYGNKSHKVGLPVQKSQGNISDKSTCYG
jgi:hypothetical protein